MPSEDEELEDLSQLIVNTKTKKRGKDLLTISEIIWRMKERLGSIQALSDRIGLSTEMIREFLLVRSLPSEVKKLVKEREIDSIGSIKEIATIKEPLKQIEFATESIGLSTTEVRDLKQLVKYAGVSPRDAKQIILKGRVQKGHYLVIFLNDDTFKKISELSSKEGTSESDLATKIIDSYMEGKDKS